VHAVDQSNMFDVSGKCSADLPHVAGFRSCFQQNAMYSAQRHYDTHHQSAVCRPDHQEGDKEIKLHPKNMNRHVGLVLGGL
jgi:hypothetical protein